MTIPNTIWGTPLIENGFMVVPKEWNSTTNIPMKTCDKSDALVMMVDGRFLNCVNEEDTAKMKAMIHAYNSGIPLVKYVGERPVGNEEEV